MSHNARLTNTDESRRERRHASSRARRRQPFFFQAEDGIRDAQESRGLGDVYKRQISHKARVTKNDEGKGERRHASSRARRRHPFFSCFCGAG